MSNNHGELSEPLLKDGDDIDYVDTTSDHAFRSPHLRKTRAYSGSKPDSKNADLFSPSSVQSDDQIYSPITPNNNINSDSIINNSHSSQTQFTTSTTSTTTSTPNNFSNSSSFSSNGIRYRGGNNGNNNNNNNNNNTLNISSSNHNNSNSGEDPILASKLGTFMGVIVPSALNVFGVIIFLRLGWVVGMAGLYETTLMLIISYTIVSLTLLSFSAIASNGRIGGGGTYYLISRALGPEFGGSIGVIFYLANVAAATFYVLGFTEALVSTFHLTPDRWTSFIYSSIVLFIVGVITLMGAGIFAKASLLLLVGVSGGLFMCMFSLMLQPPGWVPGFTGFDWNNLSSNLMPGFTIDPTDGIDYDLQAVFAIFFPCVCGIMAGSNMSGDLRNPGRSIPVGSFSAAGVTFSIYLLIAFLLAATSIRPLLIENKFILQDIAFYPMGVSIALFLAVFSSALAAVVGGARVLQALARDNLIPILSPFAVGSGSGDEPVRGVLLTWLLVQGACLAGEINLIAPFITMFFLVCFCFVNFACFFLSLSGAPNFRPTFKYYSWHSALVGGVLTLGVMIYLNPIKAIASIIVLFTLFWYIHFGAPPNAWGDISQALIYHQVRKYLLRLDIRKDHTKYWRPQILLLTRHPKTSIRLIDFVNNLKKGGLYVIGQVIVGKYENNIERIQKNRRAWLDFISVSGIKAFAEIACSQSVAEGAQMLSLTSGLGFMKPNTVIVGFHSKEESVVHSVNDAAIRGMLESFTPIEPSSTDGGGESGYEGMDASQYVQMLKNFLALEKNLLVARNFEKLDKAMIVGFRKEQIQAQWTNAGVKRGGPALKTIDIWAIPSRSWKGGASDDTLALLCMFGSILHKTDVWTKNTQLRVLSFVELPSQIDREEKRFEKLLHDFRIDAKCFIFSLADLGLKSYERSRAYHLKASGAKSLVARGAGVESGVVGSGGEGEGVGGGMVTGGSDWLFGRGGRLYVGREHNNVSVQVNIPDEGSEAAIFKLVSKMSPPVSPAQGSTHVVSSPSSRSDSVFPISPLSNGKFDGGGGSIYPLFFDSLSIEDQNDIVHELIRGVSTKASSILFLPLPPPPELKEEYEPYHKELNKLSRNLPPLLLMASSGGRVITTEL